MTDDGTIEAFADVTNTLSVAGTTGMQRLCRRIVSAFGDDALGARPVRLTPIRYCAGCGGYRRLDDAERSKLANPAPVAPRRVDSLPRAVRAPVRHVLDRRATQKVLDIARNRRGAAATPCSVDHAELSAGVLARGSWFVDLESAWWNDPERSVVLPALSESGVRTAAVIADLFPLSNPEWFDRGNLDRFPSWADAHLLNDVLIAGISEFTCDAVTERRRSLGLDEFQTVEPIPMGSDGVGTPGADPAIPQPYLLMVSTIEPRKNHALALDAWERLHTRFPELSLVLVGRPGWSADDVQQRIRHHPEFGGRLRWMTRTTDSELASLYASALCTLCPSFGEGFGLSVAESMQAATPVIYSPGGAQAEAGRGFGQLVSSFDPTAWADAIARHLDEDGQPSGFNREARQALADWAAPTWIDTATALAELISTTEAQLTSLTDSIGGKP